MPDVSGASAVNTRVHTPTTKRTRGCGCIGHPAFPAPSEFRRAKNCCKPRAHRAARSRSCIRNARCLKFTRANAPSFPRPLAGGEPIHCGSFGHPHAGFPNKRAGEGTCDRRNDQTISPRQPGGNEFCLRFANHKPVVSKGCWASEFDVAFQGSGLGCSAVDRRHLRTRQATGRPAPLHRDRRHLGPDRGPALACRPSRQLHRRSGGRNGAGSDLRQCRSGRFRRGRRCRQPEAGACEANAATMRSRFRRRRPAARRSSIFRAMVPPITASSSVEDAFRRARRRHWSSAPTARHRAVSRRALNSTR